MRFVHALLAVALAAIQFAHDRSGLPLRREDPLLRLILDGIRRAHVRPQRQAEPLRQDLLEGILVARVRHLAWYRLSYAARVIIERFFGVVKRYYGFDTQYAPGWDLIQAAAVLARTPAAPVPVPA